MPMTPREMIKHLRKNGYTIVSQNGSVPENGGFL